MKGINSNRVLPMIYAGIIDLKYFLSSNVKDC